MLEIIRSNAQSWGVKLAFGLIIVVFVFWGVGSFTGGESSVVVMVNDQPITAQEFDKRLRLMVDNLQRQIPNFDPEMLKSLNIKQNLAQQMVIESLLAQEAARIGLMVTPMELRQTIETFPLFRNEAGKFDPQLYREMLAVQRETAGSFESQMRQQMLMQKLEQEVTAGAFVSDTEIKDLFLYNGEQRILEYALFPLSEYQSKVTVTEAEVQEYYNAHQAEFKVAPEADVEYLRITAADLAGVQNITEAAVKAEYEKNAARYAEPAQMKARHILLLAAENAAEDVLNKAKADIEAIAARIKAGEDFQALAKEFSQDGSAADGGNLGWFAQADMVPAFADVAFSLKPGQVSEPVRTQFGYHLIKAEETKPARQVPLAEVQDTIKQSLGTNEALGKLQNILEEIQLSTINGKSLAEAGAVFKLEPKTTGLVAASSLSESLGIKPDQVNIIISAKPNVPLDTPFTTSDGYILVMLKEFKPETTRSLAEVSGAIKTQLEIDKAKQLSQEAATAARSTINPEDPATLPAKLAKTEPVGRDGAIPNLGQNQELVAAAFNSPLQQWLPVAYALDGGFALARVVEVVKPSDETYQLAAPQIKEAVLDAKRKEMFRSFIGLLQSSATILVKNERILTE